MWMRMKFMKCAEINFEFCNIRGDFKNFEDHRKFDCKFQSEILVIVDERKFDLRC